MFRTLAPRRSVSNGMPKTRRMSSPGRACSIPATMRVRPLGVPVVCPNSAFHTNPSNSTHHQGDHYYGTPTPTSSRRGIDLPQIPQSFLLDQVLQGEVSRFENRLEPETSERLPGSCASAWPRPRPTRPKAQGSNNWPTTCFAITASRNIVLSTMWRRAGASI